MFKASLIGALPLTAALVTTDAVAESPPVSLTAAVVVLPQLRPQPEEVRDFSVRLCHQMRQTLNAELIDPDRTWDDKFARIPAIQRQFEHELLVGYVQASLQASFADFQGSYLLNGNDLGRVARQAEASLLRDAELGDYLSAPTLNLLGSVVGFACVVWGLWGLSSGLLGRRIGQPWSTSERRTAGLVLLGGLMIWSGNKERLSRVRAPLPPAVCQPQSMPPQGGNFVTL